MLEAIGFVGFVGFEPVEGFEPTTPPRACQTGPPYTMTDPTAAIVASPTAKTRPGSPILAMRERTAAAAAPPKMIVEDSERIPTAVGFFEPFFEISFPTREKTTAVPIRPTIVRDPAGTFSRVELATLPTADAPCLTTSTLSVVVLFRAC